MYSHLHLWWKNIERMAVQQEQVGRGSRARMAEAARGRSDLGPRPTAVCRVRR